jgi:hypothetical protein
MTLYDMHSSRPKQSLKPVITGESIPVRGRKTKIKGVRVVYEVGGGTAIATRDHPTATRWDVTKQGQLVLRDKNRRQIARYRQFVWREVILGSIRETIDGVAVDPT